MDFSAHKQGDMYDMRLALRAVFAENWAPFMLMSREDLMQQLQSNDFGAVDESVSLSLSEKVHAPMRQRPEVFRESF